MADGIFDRLAQSDPEAGLAMGRQYEAVLVQGAFEAWAPELLNRVRPRPGDRLLDIGCGTGIVARRAAPLVQPNGRVTGIDPTPPMLAAAREMAAKEGLTIAWQQCSAESLPFVDASFDVLTSEQSLQFVPNKAAAASEMRRVAAPQARIGIAVWNSLEEQGQPALLALHEAVHRRLGTQALLQPFSFGDKRQLYQLLDGAGFRNVAIESVTKTCKFAADGFFDFQFAAVSREPAFAQLGTAGQAALKSEIRAELAPLFARYLDGDRLALPMSSLIATAVA